MAEKKTTEEAGSGLTGILLDSIVRGIQSFVDGALESVHQMVHTFTKKLTRRAFLFCFSFLGIIFLLVGLAQLLSAVYRLPGSGETLMGVFILLIALIVYVFDRTDK